MFVSVPLDPRARVIESLLHQYSLSIRWLASKLETSHTNVNGWLAGEIAPRDRAVWARMMQAIDDHRNANRSIRIEKAPTRFIPVYAGLPAGPPGALTGDVEYEEWAWGSSDFVQWGRYIDGYSMSVADETRKNLTFIFQIPSH
jgi:hypothetical protein